MVDWECFYTLYPSLSNTNQLNNGMDCFEELTQYCGFCFNRAQNVEAIVSMVEGQCLFDWLLYKNQLEQTNIRGCQTMREKHLVVVGYFF